MSIRTITTVALAAMLVLGLTVSCQNQAETAPAKVAIGISKIVTHPALDAVEQGIQDEFAEQKVEATFDLQSANGDMSTATSIANKFKNDNVTMAIGIATPTAQALAQVITDRPVLFTAVTDPVSAKLVESFDKGGATITGISDMTPVKEQIAFLVKLSPKIKRIGHVYSSGEANAQVLADVAKAACDELGLEFVPTTVANSAEVKSAAQAIASRVDAFYVSTDNTVVSALPALVEVATSVKAPVMSADPSSAAGSPVLAAWGFDYYKMGRATGKLAIEIIKGAKTADIPTRYMTDPKDVELVLNVDAAKALGIEIPADLLAQASTVIENGVATKK